jgi:hypothetical protein
LGPHRKVTRTVDLCDAASARTDGHHVNRRTEDGVARHRQGRRDRWGAILDQTDIKRRTAHVERHQMIDSVFAPKRDGTRDAGRRSREKETMSFFTSTMGGHAAAIRLHDE